MDASMETAATAASSIAALGKYSGIKLASLGFALMGAGLMAIFRPPKSRKEMIYQACVALGTSLLFGGWLASYLAIHFGLLNYSTATLEEMLSYTATIHGLLGASSWGLFGGLATLRDKFARDPIQTVKDVKSI